MANSTILLKPTLWSLVPSIKAAKHLYNLFVYLQRMLSIDSVNCNIIDVIVECNRIVNMGDVVFFNFGCKKFVIVL